MTGLPRLPEPPFRRAVPTTPADRNGCACRLLPRLTRPSPNGRRVGIRIVTFEACSGFTRITARRIAQPPKATFVTRLQPSGYPAKPLVSFRTNRQLSGWNPPPQVFRALGAHCHGQTHAAQQMAGASNRFRAAHDPWSTVESPTAPASDHASLRQAGPAQILGELCGIGALAERSDTHVPLDREFWIDFKHTPRRGASFLFPPELSCGDS